jgi:hypothetical protein
MTNQRERKYLRSVFALNRISDLQYDAGVLSVIAENAMNGERLDQLIMSKFFKFYSGNGRVQWRVTCH